MFLGLCNYYRNFITHFSDTAEPLYRLLRKEASFEWTIECAAAFAKLKHALTSAPALILPDPIKPYTLRTDASQTGLSAILLQPGDDGRLHPVAYASKTLNPAERRYNTTERIDGTSVGPNQLSYVLVQTSSMDN